MNNDIPKLNLAARRSWRVVGDYIVDCDGFNIVHVLPGNTGTYDRYMTSKLIVLAVNMHRELINALSKSVTRSWENYPPDVRAVFRKRYPSHWIVQAENIIFRSTVGGMP